MTPPVRSVLTVAAVLATLQLAGCAGSTGISMEDLLTGALPATARPLDEPTVAAGLKEALEVGARNAVETTSQLDGFRANELIRIPLPAELEKTGDALRSIGFGAQVDELELTMNRAAERAAGEATDVFIEIHTSSANQVQGRHGGCRFGCRGGLEARLCADAVASARYEHTVPFCPVKGKAVGNGDTHPRYVVVRHAIIDCAVSGHVADVVPGHSPLEVQVHRRDPRLDCLDPALR